MHIEGDTMPTLSTMTRTIDWSQIEAAFLRRQIEAEKLKIDRHSTSQDPEAKMRLILLGKILSRIDTGLVHEMEYAVAKRSSLRTIYGNDHTMAQSGMYIDAFNAQWDNIREWIDGGCTISLAPLN